jgi:hypothetical protein
MVKSDEVESIAIIIAGIGLSGAYFRAVFVSWRRYQAAERRKQFSLRELYATHTCDEKKDVSVPNVICVEKSLDAKFTGIAAITDGPSACSFTYTPQERKNTK